MKKHLSIDNSRNSKNGFNYCRTCYKHLAGYVGVAIAEAMEEQGYLKKLDTIYLVTEKGWGWLSQFDISKINFNKSQRPLTRQCVDGTERRPHLAGQLGDLLLEKMCDKGWFEKVESTRELLVTQKGRHYLNVNLGVAIKS